MTESLCVTAKGRAKVRETCEAATYGPWIDCTVDKDGCGGFDLPPDHQFPTAPTGALIQSACHTSSEAVIQPSNYDGSPWCLPEDRAFIAMARTELPAALDRIEKLEAALMVILPLAKGYASAHQIGSNMKYVQGADRLVHPELYQEDEPA